MLGLTLITAALLPASLMAVPTPAPQVVPSTTGPVVPGHASDASTEALEKRHFGMYGGYGGMYGGYGGMYGYGYPAYG
jgi:hypothetical protein